jgi:hypothetical protein
VAKLAKVIVKKSNFGPAKLTVTALVALFNGVGKPAPGDAATVPESMLDTGWYVPFVAVVIFAILKSPKCVVLVDLLLFMYLEKNYHLGCLFWVV